MVQWLGFHAFIAKGQDSIPGQETGIPQPVRPDKKIKDKQIKKRNKDVKGDCRESSKSKEETDRD